jgi:cytochrome c551/c552
MADALAVRYWPGGAEAQQREALGAADVAVVYGSDGTVAEVRSAASATTRVVAYHHRVGVALIGRDVMVPSVIDAVATDTARAVALFEQRGCVCPHVVYVECGGELAGPDFADGLATAFAALEGTLPSVTLDAEEGAALQQLRGTAELLAATGSGFVRHGGVTAPWTVIYAEHADHGRPVTLARGVRVQEVEDASSLASELSPLGAHLQSVAYAGLDGRVTEVAESLGRAGASRVVPIDRVSFPPPWWLHDGRAPLRDLVRWVEVER